MIAYVVDTNVAIVANCKSDHVSNECEGRCIERLSHIQANGIVVVDQTGLILEEYRRHLNPKGQPGVGDAFYKHVFQNLANPDRCDWVIVTPLNGSRTRFAEFPNDPDLNGFDFDDRKFVAVAVASVHDPVIQNATDSDWLDHEIALKRHGINVEFLCQGLLDDER